MFGSFRTIIKPEFHFTFSKTVLLQSPLSVVFILTLAVIGLHQFKASRTVTVTMLLPEQS